MRRIGLGFSGVPLSVPYLVEYAKLAEKRGYDSIWIAEDYFLRDAFCPLASIASATKRIKLGTGVINPYTRHPVLLAESIATLDEISKGRSILALGTGVISLIQQMGIKVEKPLQTMRESVELIRRLLAEEETTYQGSVLRADKVKFGANPYFDLVGRFKPFRKKIPVYVAAMGPKMLQLAGEIGDGVLFSAGSPVPYVKYAVENLDIGAKKANRTMTEVDVCCYIACAPLKRNKPPGTVIRGFVSFMVAYASQDVLKMTNIDSSQALRIREVLEKDGMAEASKHVSDEMIDAFGAFGTPERILERVEEYVSQGVDLPILFPMPPDFRLTTEIGGRYAKSRRR
jgi:5,10-methylenetetrahydromethanopterin reductase